MQTKRETRYYYYRCLCFSSCATSVHHSIGVTSRRGRQRLPVSEEEWKHADQIRVCIQCCHKLVQLDGPILCINRRETTDERDVSLRRIRKETNLVSVDDFEDALDGRVDDGVLLVGDDVGIALVLGVVAVAHLHGEDEAIAQLVGGENVVTRGISDGKQATKLLLAGAMGQNTLEQHVLIKLCTNKTKGVMKSSAREGAGTITNSDGVVLVVVKNPEDGLVVLSEVSAVLAERSAESLSPHGVRDLTCAASEIIELSSHGVILLRGH